jgi:hypothetical protein
VITLGSDTTVESNDVITLPAASVIDAAGNVATSNIVFTVVIPLTDPTVLSPYPVSVSDVDTSGSYNLIVGIAGVNTIMGTSGDDIITGNASGDAITGNGGNDIFDYNVITDGDDSISDFVIGSGAEADKLDLSDLLTYASSDTSANFLTVVDSGAGNGVTIAIDANGDSSGTDLTITLTGIGTGGLALTDFETNNLIVL